MSEKYVKTFICDFCKCNIGDDPKQCLACGKHLCYQRGYLDNRKVCGIDKQCMGYTFLLCQKCNASKEVSTLIRSHYKRHAKMSAIWKEELRDKVAKLKH